MTESGSFLPTGAERDMPLRRLIGPWQASSVVMGMVVGAGIFRSASFVGSALGSASAVYAAWTIGGIVALIGALCYAELSSAFPHPGGDYRFLKEAYGDTIAFLFAWSRFAVIFTASAAMLAFVGTDYLGEMIPMDGTARAILAGTLVVALSAINLRGLRTSARSEVVFVLLDVVALLAVGGAALWLTLQGGVGHHPASGSYRTPDFGVAMVYVMLAYGGFNDAATLSAEVRRPRDMTRALIGGMSAVTALYLVANWAYLQVLGSAGLATSDAPAAAVMLAVFGRTGETIMVAAVGLATMAVLNALLIVGGRTLYAAAADTPGLERLAGWDLSRGVPRAAILLQTVITLLLIVWGALTPTGFATMVDYMSPVYWLFLTLSALAVPILRRKRPAAVRPYRMPFALLLSAIFAGVALYILRASVVHVGPIGALTSFGTIVIGLVARWILHRYAARRDAREGACVH
ncbi:APC family permease [Sphingomonas sp. 2SG]|uniref:APC family permease n=1 Tax=Sphingomonas sp. 2SG TaxID=2502201 RepID=UPI0010F9C869|nr:APC family permease [Sphingomonas sp. 2SG]